MVSGNVVEVSGRLMRREGELKSLQVSGVWFDRGIRGNVHLEKNMEKAEKWEVRIGCMSRVNGEMELDRGRLIWELLARSCLKHASEKAVCKNLEKIQENIGRKLVGENSTIAEVAVRGEGTWAGGSWWGERKERNYLDGGCRGKL